MAGEFGVINDGNNTQPDWRHRQAKERLSDSATAGHIDPPMSAAPFVWNGAIEMPAIGAALGIISFIVPSNQNAVIWRVANGTAIGGGIAGWVNGSGTLVWQILRNGSPFKNMNNLVALIGLVEQGGSLLPSPTPRAG